MATQGLTYRRFRGDADFALMADVTRLSRAADRIEEVDNAESLARMYSNLKNFDPYRDIIMAEVGGKLVGYRHCVWWERVEASRLYHHFGFLLPDWRG